MPTSAYGGMLSERLLAKPAVPAAQRQPDTSSYGHLVQAQSELYRANYENNTLPSPAVFEQLIMKQTQGNSVPLGLLYYDVNIIDTLSLARNQLTIQNGFLRDVPGRTASPYLTRRLLAVSPTTDAVRTGTIRFSLPSDLIWSNLSGITNVEVRAGDNNQTALLTPDGSAATFSYSTPGKKTVRFVVRFSDNTTKTTYAAFKVY